MICSRCCDILDICSAEAASSAELELISRLPSSMASMVLTTCLGGGGLLLDGGGHLLGELVEVAGGAGDLAGAAGLLLGGVADLAGVLVDIGDGSGDVGEGLAEFVGELEAFVDGASGFQNLAVVAGDLLLDAGDEFGDLVGGFGGAVGELGEFVGEDGEASAMFSGAGGFDGGVEGEEVGLLGKFLDKGRDAADGGGLLLQEFAVFLGDGVYGLDAMEAALGALHGVHAIGGLLAGAVTELKQAACAFGDAVDGGGHLLDRVGAFGDALRLGTGAFHHAVEADAHLMHGAGGLVDAIGGAFAHIGETVGGIGDLAGGGGDFGGTLAALTDQGFKAVAHLDKGVAEGVIAGAGMDIEWRGCRRRWLRSGRPSREDR